MEGLQGLLGLEFKGTVKGIHYHGLRIAADIGGRTLYGYLEVDFTAAGTTLFPSASLSPFVTSSLFRPTTLRPLAPGTRFCAPLRPVPSASTEPCLAHVPLPLHETTQSSTSQSSFIAQSSQEQISSVVSNTTPIPVQRQLVTVPTEDGRPTTFDFQSNVAGDRISAVDRQESPQRASRSMSAPPVGLVMATSSAGMVLNENNPGNPGVSSATTIMISPMSSRPLQPFQFGYSFASTASGPGDLFVTQLAGNRTSSTQNTPMFSTPPLLPKRKYVRTGLFKKDQKSKRYICPSQVRKTQRQMVEDNMRLMETDGFNLSMEALDLQSANELTVAPPQALRSSELDSPDRKEWNPEELMGDSVETPANEVLAGDASKSRASLADTSSSSSSVLAAADGRRPDLNRPPSSKASRPPALPRSQSDADLEKDVRSSFAPLSGSSSGSFPAPTNAARSRSASLKNNHDETSRPQLKRRLSTPSAGTMMVAVAGSPSVGTCAHAPLFFTPGQPPHAFAPQSCPSIVSSSPGCGTPSSRTSTQPSLQRALFGRTMCFPGEGFSDTSSEAGSLGPSVLSDGFSLTSLLTLPPSFSPNQGTLMSTYGAGLLSGHHQFTAANVNSGNYSFSGSVCSEGGYDPGPTFTPMPSTPMAGLLMQQGRSGVGTSSSSSSSSSSDVTSTASSPLTSLYCPVVDNSRTPTGQSSSSSSSSVSCLLPMASSLPTFAPFLGHGVQPQILPHPPHPLASTASTQSQTYPSTTSVADMEE